LSDAGEAWNKDSDMNIRKNMILSGNYDVFISVHQNSYSDVSCRGGQVFYSDNNPSNAVFAQILQEKLRECAPFENKRTPLIDNDYKLLKGNTMPSVIVECGFMSNSAELELLLSEQYCEKIAECIAVGTEAFVRDMN
jgi:N-acetylmuramoyl-L-alanine amidase